MFKQSRLYLILSSICVVLFVVNLIIGKIEVTYRVDMIVHFEGVAEFVLLLAAVIFFVIGTLFKEQSMANASQKPKEVES